MPICQKTEQPHERSALEIKLGCNLPENVIAFPESARDLPAPKAGADRPSPPGSAPAVRNTSLENALALAATLAFCLVAVLFALALGGAS